MITNAESAIRGSEMNFHSHTYLMVHGSVTVQNEEP